MHNKFDQTATRRALIESRKRQDERGYHNQSKHTYKNDRKYDRADGPYRKESQDLAKSNHETKKEESKSKQDSNAFNEPDSKFERQAEMPDKKKKSASNSWMGEDEEDFDDQKKNQKPSQAARDRKPEKTDDKKAPSKRKDVFDGYAYQATIPTVPKVYFQRRDAKEAEPKRDTRDAPKPAHEDWDDRKKTKNAYGSSNQHPQEDLFASSSRFGGHKQGKPDRYEKPQGSGPSKQKRGPRPERYYGESEEDVYLPRDKLTKEHHHSSHTPKEYGAKDHGAKEHAPKDHAPKEHGTKEHGTKEHITKEHISKEHGANPSHHQSAHGSNAHKADKKEQHPASHEKAHESQGQTNPSSPGKSQAVQQPPSSNSSPTNTPANSASQAEKTLAIPPLLTTLGMTGPIAANASSYAQLAQGYTPYYSAQVPQAGQSLQSAPQIQFLPFYQPGYWPQFPQVPAQYYYPQQYTGVPQMQPSQQVPNQIMPNMSGMSGATYMMYPGYQAQPPTNNTQQ